MVARRIDRYTLLEEVGSGGMAVVYRGHDTTLDRVVAIKVMHPHLASREESRRRFSREARAVARLRHPSIVEIYDFSGDEARESFIVTEFVQGRTLRRFGDEVGFGLPEIGVLVAAQLADALAHAHEAGIVHRDLKPENVMVREDGVLKLMDFGIARLIGGDERMTMTGALVGSPLHMAPEIIEGREAGEAADVFALGTILYWMVTGRMAFAGNNTTQTLRQILEGQYEDPRIANPACSDEIAELIGRCLQRDPAARPSSMAALRDDLVALVEPLGLGRIEEALRAFLLDPIRWTEATRALLVERLVAEGEAALAAKRPARALGLFNRVLALDEGNERVLGHLERMRRGRVLRRRLKRGLAAVAIGCAVGIAGVAVQRGLGGEDGAARSGQVEGRGADGADTGAGEAAARPAGGARPEGGDVAAEGAGDVGAIPAGGAPVQGDVETGASPAGDAPVQGDGGAGASPPGDAPDPGGGTGPSARAPAGAAPPGAAQPGDAAGAAPSRPEGAGARGSAAGTQVATRGGEAAQQQPRGDRPVAEPAALQRVQLRWVPQGASLYIDGSRVDTVAPAWSGELPAGTHTFALAHPDCCQPWEETIELRGGDPVRRSIALAPLESGWFEVACDHPDAEVWFEGTFKGTVAEVNARGGVPVAFSRDDSGRDRYVKTVRFRVLPPRGSEGLSPATAEVVVRAGQKARSPQIRLETRNP